MKRILIVVGAVLSMTCSTAAWSDGYYLGHVTVIDAGRVGNITPDPAIYFLVDVDIGTTCLHGTSWLYWVPPTLDNDVAKQMANTKAVLSSLQLAYALGKPVLMYALTPSPPNGFCQVVYLTNQP